ncbi:MAG TPA: arginine deiminase-related protein [Dokdonella sp.]|uniref:arginine deiminase-related protein n=1 Tax=Dokdonella sp. TaxID=2291710 RepID=UPI0025C5CC3A|nr:arginine deiminase-related protein [Dokdonella sp.]MBX3691146.1 amidinotransferase [Dokdonella sp.]MCW5566853.1 amidinotransferase [Dokdonella sp.]HNR91112.1 arginine deiminase-related protein [Dokdonella sp.]
MIVDNADAFLSAFAALPVRAEGATARAAFLITPAAFSLAVESAGDNRYMDLGLPVDPLRALTEHAELARRLGEDLPVASFPGDPAAPDGIFPNNVFATVPGRLIIGRMRHAVRRREAERHDIRAWFDLLGYAASPLPSGGYVAELTGSLVIDRARNIGYCGLSERCDRTGARAMHEAFGLDLTWCFDLAAGEYHTNVVLAILAGRAAIVAPDGFADARVPMAIAKAYAGATVVLDAAQKNAFAANSIALSPSRAWMSARAAAALRDDQVATLASAGFSIGAVELGEIEKAGGSLRCCVAEIY